MELGPAVILSLIAILAVIAVVVVAPLVQGDPEPVKEARREQLEAAKEAKYREIRDAELDREMGKLSAADWRQIDAELRREAVAILVALEELGPEEDGLRA